MELTHKALADRLRSARTASGLTQKAVADQLGISRSTLAQIESGHRKVTGLELAQLAKLYGLAVTDFLSDVLDSHREPVLLRALTEARSDPQVQAAIGEAMSLIREIMSLRDLLGDTRVNPGLPVYQLERLTSRWDAVELGNRLAVLERQRLGLGLSPVPNLASLLENQGALVLEMELPQGVSGFTFRVSKITAFAVQASQAPVRQRFSLVHEYCHAICDWGPNEGVSIGDEKAIVSRSEEAAELGEVRANAFAAAFLMPADGVRNYLASLGKGSPSRPVETVFAEGQMDRYPIAEGRLAPRSQDIGWLDIRMLSDYFLVSRESTVWRLLNLHILDKDETDHLLAIARGEVDGSEPDVGQPMVASTPARQPVARTEQFRLARQLLHRLAVEALYREEISAGKFRELAGQAGIDKRTIEGELTQVRP